MKPLRVLALIPALLLATACLETTETRHTLYLAPDGSVAWSVLELELHSGAEEADRRQAEEAEYLELFAAGRHPIAEALWGLGATTVESRLVRSERPYTAVTEARFRSAEELARTLLRQLGIPGEVHLSQEGPHTRLTIELAPTDAWEEEEEEDGDLLALLDACSGLRVMLTEGEFVAVEGLRLEDAGHTAVFPACEQENLAADGRLVFQLVW